MYPYVPKIKAQCSRSLSSVAEHLVCILKVLGSIPGTFT